MIRGTFTPGAKVTWDQLFGIIEKDVKAVIQEQARELKFDVQEAWPVKTGRSKAGWKLGGNQYGYFIFNKVKNPETGFDYVPLLWYGSSSQMPQGGDPIVRRRTIILLQELKKIKWNKRRRRYDTIKTRTGRPEVRL